MYYFFIAIFSMGKIKRENKSLPQVQIQAHVMDDGGLKGMVAGNPWKLLKVINSTEGKSFFLIADNLDNGIANNIQIVLCVSFPDMWVVGDEVAVNIKRPDTPFLAMLSGGKAIISAYNNNKILLTFDYRTDNNNWFKGKVTFDL